MSGGMEDTACFDNKFISPHLKDVGCNSIVDGVKYMKQLVADHWNYVEKVLMHSGNKSSDELSEIEFHYKSAMAHGFRHGVEACEKGMVTWEGLLHQK